MPHTSSSREGGREIVRLSSRSGGANRLSWGVATKMGGSERNSLDGWRKEEKVYFESSAPPDAFKGGLHKKDLRREVIATRRY